MSHHRRGWVFVGLMSLLSLMKTGCQIDLGTPENRDTVHATKAQSATDPLTSPHTGTLQQARYETVQRSPEPLPAHHAGLPHPVDPLVIHEQPLPPYERPPSELSRVIHPPYIIEPPDILFLDAARLVPKAPYRLRPLDVLHIQSSESLPREPIQGQFTISPEGYVSLGYSYGSVRVAGLSLQQAHEALQKYLAARINGAQVAVSLAEFRGVQQIRGEHLVRPDGTINLGTYGCVNVTGLTLAQAKKAIEHHLSRNLQDPEISVDVYAYNSKAYYVIIDGGGFGQQVFKFPSTGNETVLDAIQQIGGLPAVSSLRRIWVARPAPAGHACLQILPVNWQAVVMGGATETNYQLFPGDRIYVAADRMIAADNWLAKILAPIERLLGITLLGASTVRTIDNRFGTVGFITGF